MPGQLPLSALLSQVLVAFTIECDNEFEHRMPHRTSNHGRTEGQGKVPWLVSMAMWSTCMRFVGPDGVTVGQLQALARAGTNLAGLQRWGYINLAPDPADTRPKPPRSDWVIRATPQGRRAQEIWQPLTSEIEERWRERLGAAEINGLTAALQAMDSQLDPALPDCLPIIAYGLFSELPKITSVPAMTRARSLPELLSRVLLALAVSFETDSSLSLAISANVLRVLGEQPVRVRDVPVLAGVSKEGVSMAANYLLKGRLIGLGPDPGGARGQAVWLTKRGQGVRDAHQQQLRYLDEDWEERSGTAAIAAIREPLERLVGEPATSPLWRGLGPYPDGWRAKVRKPQVLPHYPMVLHRGGFPDGS